MDGLANVGGIASHLDREPHFTDQIAGMRAENATAENTTASRASSESVEVNIESELRGLSLANLFDMINFLLRVNFCNPVSPTKII